MLVEEVPWLQQNTHTHSLGGRPHTAHPFLYRGGRPGQGYQLGILKTDLNPEMTVLAHCLGLIYEESIRKRESPGPEQRIKEDPPSEAWDTKAWGILQQWLLRRGHLLAYTSQTPLPGKEGDWRG